MIISPLYNDVSKKIEFWKAFSNDNACEFKHYITKSHDASRISLNYTYNGVKILFEESDGKPLVCKFRIKVEKRVLLEISEKTLFDKLFSSTNNNSHSFLKKYNIKSNCIEIKNSINNDSEFLNLCNDSEFYGLYGYFKGKELIITLTASYFVDNYKKLEEISLIIKSLIDKIIINHD